MAKPDTAVNQSSTGAREAFSEKAEIQATAKNKRIFGFHLFNNKNLTFEPSVNIPTPTNYVIGIGDELMINVWGASQQTYQLMVDQNGTINITDLGPIPISGMNFNKAKSFNAKMETDFDDSISTVNIVAQDMGRVILNLITNAFYVVQEKKSLQPDGYEPTVSVGTKIKGKQVLISIQDNGSGIPKKVLNKIFNPFFTTKPSGKGTGLGLSLSYDIVKAHGGELKVETKEGEGTTFTIVLPANNLK